MTTSQLRLFDPVRAKAYHPPWEIRGRTNPRWLARFKRPTVVWPDGSSDPRPHPGWACPDCGEAEATPYLLWINHGWNPGMEGERPWHEGMCSKQVRNEGWPHD